MRSTGSPRFAPSGEITRWYGSVEDIHDRKLQEEESLREIQKHTQEDREAVEKGILVAQILQDSISELDSPEEVDDPIP
jgi:hypothetical protein